MYSNSHIRILSFKVKLKLFSLKPRNYSADILSGIESHYLHSINDASFQSQTIIALTIEPNKNVWMPTARVHQYQSLNDTLWIRLLAFFQYFDA